MEEGEELATLAVLPPLKTQERKAEAASAAELADAAEVTCGRSPPKADAEAETALKWLAGTEGVTAREREVASERPHGAEEPKEAEVALGAPEEEEADNKELELIEHTHVSAD